MRLIVLSILLLIAIAPAHADDAQADKLRGDLTTALKEMQESREAHALDQQKRMQELNARVLARQQQRAENEAHNQRIRAERMATRDAQQQASNQANMPYYLRTIPVQ